MGRGVLQQSVYAPKWHGQTYPSCQRVHRFVDGTCGESRFPEEIFNSFRRNSASIRRKIMDIANGTRSAQAQASPFTVQDAHYRMWRHRKCFDWRVALLSARLESRRNSRSSSYRGRWREGIARQLRSAAVL